MTQLKPRLGANGLPAPRARAPVGPDRTDGVGEPCPPAPAPDARAGWERISLTDLTAASELLDHLENAGVRESELVVLGACRFVVRWRRHLVTPGPPAAPRSAPNGTPQTGSTGASGPPTRDETPDPFRRTTVPHTRTRSVADPLEYYLGEIARIPVINWEQEQHLALRIAGGDARARDQMIVSHLGLVVTVARAYSANGLPLEELVGEGTLGLVRAVESFDAELGPRFATYATYWVRQSVRQAVNRDRNTVRLPHYMLNLLARWHRAENALRRETGAAPTEEEIAARLGLSRKRTRAVREALRVRGSGQSPDTSEGDDALARIADEKRCAPAESLAALDERRATAGRLGSLSAREGEILRRRFGLDGGAPATLREVGAQLGCTRERVRQIENAALAKLRPYFAA